jgi:molybdate transport system ATP-binding protein
VSLAFGPEFVIGEGFGILGALAVAIYGSWAAILVATQRPQPSSARNTWPAQIAGLTMLADRVRLDLDGQPPTWTSTPCRQAS